MTPLEARGRRLTGRASIVVPTLGRSPLLADCLRALRVGADAVGVAIVLVDQGAGVPEAVAVLADRRVRVPEPLGFATAVNLGLAAGDEPWVALVNDDAIVEPGWLARLVDALEATPGAASAQGVNLLPGEPARVDGLGLAWNRWLQAIQVGHGEPADAAAAGDRAPREVFGVSATAALYRRSALRTVAAAPREGSPAPGVEAPPEVFDSRLETYYEDVDLAVRLRAAGHTALLVPAATARHAGGLTAGTGAGRWRRVYGNRYLVLARFLGRSFWRLLPRLAVRDLLDLAHAAGRGEVRRVAGIVTGWGRAAIRLPGFLHRGEPVLPRSELAPGRRAGRAAEVR